MFTVSVGLNGFNVLIFFHRFDGFQNSGSFADLYAFEPVDGPTRLSPW